MHIRTQIRAQRACKLPGLCGRRKAFAAALQLSYTRMCLTAPCRMRYGRGLRVGRATPTRLVNAMLRVGSGTECAACTDLLSLLET